MCCVHYYYNNLILYLFNEDCRQLVAMSGLPPYYIACKFFFGMKGMSLGTMEYTRVLN